MLSSVGGAKATKPIPEKLIAEMDKKNIDPQAPMLVRLFKQEAELEVWKQDREGRFDLVKTYPICRWSGDLGPKAKEGDRQAPEGFYTITPGQMNPQSAYYLSFNIGYPNAYDRSLGHTGSQLMVHGDCSSRGCYAMTDEQIGEIYALGREAFFGGQRGFQVQAYPFRMTPANLARHRNNPNMPFWKMIKEGNDHFEVTHLEPKVDVCDHRYVFDAQPPPAKSAKPLVFTPTGRCPAYVVAQDIVEPVQAKQQNDEVQYARWSKIMPPAPIRTGLDGGMNRVFLAQTNGNIPPARVPPPTGLPAQPQPPPMTADDGGSTFAGRLFGGLFGSKPAEQTKVASTESGSRGSEPASTGTAHRTQSAAHSQTAAAAAKPTTPLNGELRKGDETVAAKPKPAPQQEANAAAPPAKPLLNGAQPVVPAGSFDSRWGGLQ